jgi:uncharacterized metal-binding protein YceD (DUF177 family)
VGDYEPEVVDPSRVDLQWLMEEQVLLALPLVPMHEPGQCGGEIAASLEAEVDAETRQKPFGNLRDMLRER